MPTVRQSFFAAFTRRYPLYSGGIRFANHPFVKKLGGNGEELVWAKVGGGKVLCNLNDLVGRTAYYTGDLDRKISWICSRIVRPGDTVLDIGANVGIVSLWLAKLVGLRGRVHAFEPNPELQKLLIQTLEKNRISNITLHPVALGAAAGRMQLRIEPGNSGSGTLVQAYDQVNSEVTTVPVVTLDSVMAKEGVRAIRLIKIDVEGFEAEVLRGGGHLLNSLRPQAILFESVEQGNGRLADRPVFQILQAAGYGFFAIPKCRFRMSLKPVAPDGANDQSATDFLAVLRSNDFAQMAMAVKANSN